VLPPGPGALHEQARGLFSGGANVSSRRADSDRQTHSAHIASPEEWRTDVATSVAVLAVRRADRLRLALALRGLGTLLFCEQCEELLRAVTTRPVSAVLTELYDATGAATLPVVQQLHRTTPSVPVLVYCALDHRSCHALVEYVACGATSVVLRGYDDGMLALRRSLSSAVLRNTCAKVIAAIVPLLGARSAVVFEHCALNASAGHSVADVARSLGCDRRTLVNRLNAGHLPPPREVIAWCRLLLAARLFEDAGRSVDNTALALGFASGSALRKTLLHYTGLRPRDVRQRGGFLYLLERFHRSVIFAAQDAAQAVGDQRPQRGAGRALVAELSHGGIPLSQQSTVAAPGRG
jgi:AraC-like DNA-binding protein